MPPPPAQLSSTGVVNRMTVGFLSTKVSPAGGGGNNMELAFRHLD